MDSERIEGTDGPTSSLLPCDVVMAGGVTSGVIYPGAIAMLARRYSFQSIGGTSVGAIAAAGTAAAEYGRRTGKKPDAFKIMDQLAKEISELAPDGHTRLFHLFTADSDSQDTRALMRVLSPAINKQGLARFAGLLATIWLPVALALAAALLLDVGLSLTVSPGLSRGLAALAYAGFFLVGVVLAAALVGWSLWRLLKSGFKALTANQYGICTGLAGPAFPTGSASGRPFEGLTPWIDRIVQDAAGLTIADPPLTFGQLWRAPMLDGSSPQGDARAIDLTMMTSDISRHRSLQMPFLEMPTELYANEATLALYFPTRIVGWMKQHAGVPDPRLQLDDGTFRLPAAADLPIVFAARLSLSFPVLLSAVPLKTPDYGATPKGGKTPLRDVWFSDGGLTSNFPVHFFDSPIPRHPTFCFNLVDSRAALQGTSRDGDSSDEGQRGPGRDKEIARAGPKEREPYRAPGPHDQDPAPNEPVWGYVEMPGNRFRPASFTDFTTLGEFAMTLVNTARFWSDNNLVIAPGVRDRVVHVALSKGEGGLKLDMDAETIKSLDARGRAAGLLIGARFDPAATTDPETGGPVERLFANHRWIRYRNFMAAFEDMSRRFARSRRRSDVAAVARRESVLDDMIAGTAPERLSNAAPVDARSFYQSATDRLEQLALWMAAQQLGPPPDPAATFDRVDPHRAPHAKPPAGAAPRPKMRVRVLPLADRDPRAENSDLPP